MEESFILEVEASDLQQLQEALGIPEDDIYVELAPDVKLFYSTYVVRRAADIPPLLVEFVLNVGAQLTAMTIWGLVQKIHKGGGQSITIVKRHKVKVTLEEETVLEIQKHLAEEDE